MYQWRGPGRFSGRPARCGRRNSCARRCRKTTCTCWCRYRHTWHRRSRCSTAKAGHRCGCRTSACTCGTSTGAAKPPNSGVAPLVGPNQIRARPPDAGKYPGSQTFATGGRAQPTIPAGHPELGGPAGAHRGLATLDSESPAEQRGLVAGSCAAADDRSRDASSQSTPAMP